MKLNKRFMVFITALIFGMSISSYGYSAPKRNPPSIPTGITAKTVSSSEIDLSWNSVSGAAGYKLYMASPDDLNYTQIASLTGTSYKHTTLKASTSYWYFVRSYNSYGTSGDSIHINALTPAAPVVTGSKFLLGFATYYYSGDSSSYNSMVNNTSAINEIATDTYTTDGAGNITGLVPVSQISYANSNGIKPVAMITNNFSGSIAQALLENSINRQALEKNILNALSANGYKGVNIDIEGVYSYDRDYFTAFMNELYTQLNPLGYEVSVCVPAKTSDSSSNTWNYAYDYAKLSNYADRIVIMSYDEHYPGGQPGAVASIGWVQSVANYAVTAIPQSKILLGLAAYGYDWSSKGTKAYGIDAILNLAAANKAVINWDTTAQSPYFTYTEEDGTLHTVWFENGTSIGYKLDIINNMNLAGGAMWRLGLENTDYWNMIKTKMGQ